MDNIVFLLITVFVVDRVGTDVKDVGLLPVFGENSVKLSVVINDVDGADDGRTAIVALKGVTTMDEVDNDDKGLLLETVDNVMFPVVVAVVVINAVDEITAIVVLY